MRTPDDLAVLASEMDGYREKYLKFRAVVERFEQGRHTAFAKCYMATKGDTVKDREYQAYASEEYKTYLDDWDKARKSMVKAQVQYENRKCAFDALQSGLAYDRDAMKRLG